MMMMMMMMTDGQIPFNASKRVVFFSNIAYFENTAAIQLIPPHPRIRETKFFTSLTFAFYRKVPHRKY